MMGHKICFCVEKWLIIPILSLLLLLIWSTVLQRGRTFHDIHFASKKDKAHLEGVLLLKERTLLYRDRFFLQVDPH